MDINDRLEEFTNYLRIGKRDFENETGISSGTLSKRPKNGVRSDTIRRIKEKYPLLNTEWLIMGTGDMLIEEMDVENTDVNEGLRSRLLQFIAHINVSQNEFARSCGFGQGFVSRLTDNAQESTFKRIEYRYPQLNIEWLRTGQGNMILTEEEQNQRDYNLRTFSERVLYVPLVSQYAHGGYLSGFSNDEYIRQLPMIPFIVDRDARGNYVAFEVRGESMDDGTRESYARGDIVLCREVELGLYRDAQMNYRHNDFVIVHNDGIIIKRITAHNVDKHTITVHSFNPIFPDMEIDLADVKQLFSVILKQQQCKR